MQVQSFDCGTPSGMSEPFDPYRKWLGIPTEEQPPNHYRLLGIPLFESDLDVIENAAHRQMVYVRTFQHGKHAELSQRLLNELASAKVCLLTPDRKQTYDQQLHASLAPQEAAPRLASPAVARPAKLAARSGRSRRYVMPLLFGGLGVAAVIGVVAAAVLLEKAVRSPRSDASEEDGVQSAGSSLVAGRTSVRPAADAAVDGASGGNQREARIRKQLDRVREMQAKRELGQAQALLDGVGSLSRDEELRAEKERLDLVQRFLNDFWKAVERGQGRVQQRLERLEEGDKPKTVYFEFRGDVIELRRNEQKEDQFDVMVDGKPWTGGRRELPARVAVPLALIGLEDSDGFGRFQIAAFLFVDGQGKREENRRLALDFYQLAVRMVGQPNLFLAAEFEIPAPIIDEDSQEISLDSFKVRPRLSRPRAD